MKIYITKNIPSEFCRRGMDSLTVWFKSKPEFSWGNYKDPAFGLYFDKEAEFDYPEWVGVGDRVSGNVLRKSGGPIATDVWEALLYSYNFDRGQYPYDYDIYGPVDDYYDNARKYYAYHKIGRSDRYYNAPNFSTKVLHFIAQKEAMKRACIAVEKEGQRWWEWVLEYDIEFSLKSIEQ